LVAKGLGLIRIVPKLTKPAYLAVMLIWTKIEPSADLLRVIDLLRLPVLTGQSDLILLAPTSKISERAKMIEGFMLRAS